MDEAGIRKRRKRCLRSRSSWTPRASSPLAPLRGGSAATSGRPRSKSPRPEAASPRPAGPTGRSGSCDLADAQLAELSVEGRAPDPQPPRDLRHPPAIMADGEADDVGFDRFQRAQIAVGIVEGDAGAVRQRRLLRGAVERRPVEIAGAPREGGFLGDLREIG